MPPYAQQAQATLATLKVQYPSSSQAHNIWDEMVSGFNNIEVNALAGVGKTFTSVQGAGLVGTTRSVIILAFNKPIQLEADAKIKQLFGKDTKIVAKTFNGAGFGACMNQWPALRSSQEPVNPDRTWQMLPDNMPVSIKSPITKLVALCKNTLVPPTRNNLLDLSATYDIDLFDDGGGDFADQVLETVPTILEQSKTPTDCIDFNDQVWLPVIWQLPVRTYDLVIVDEAQDLNAARMQLAIMLAQAPTRIKLRGR